MHLLIEYFESFDRRRNAEFLLALHENLGLNEITKIHLFIEPESRFHFLSNKIHFVNREARPTIGEMLHYANENLPEEICIIANSDIIFNNTLQIAQRICDNTTILALSRWEIDYEGTLYQYRLFDNAASQDSWIFQAPVNLSEKLDFFLGQPGCDNRFAKILHDNGYKISNPSKRIITAHFHSTLSQTSVPRSAEKVDGPYLLITPSADLKIAPDYIEVEEFDNEGNPVLVRPE